LGQCELFGVVDGGLDWCGYDYFVVGVLCLGGDLDGCVIGVDYGVLVWVLYF